MITQTPVARTTSLALLPGWHVPLSQVTLDNIFNRY
jgi:hypothetical protein